MHIKACLIAFISAALLLSVPAIAAEGPQFGLAGGLGLTKMDDDFFLTTSLYPDLAIGKLGVGLEVTLNINKNGIRKEDWAEWDKALARSIRYIRWGFKGSPLYLQLGQLTSHDIGTGILVGNYTNISAADLQNGTRKIGAVVDVDFGLVGMETLVNNVQDFSLRAGRVYVHPTMLVPFLHSMNRLSVGFSVAEDSRNDLRGQAVDAMLPLGSGERFVLYAHQASVREGSDDSVSGAGAGLRGTLGPVRFVAEIRKLEAGFVPTPFSKSYETVGIRPGVPETQGYLLGADLLLSRGDLVLGVQQEFNTKDQSNPRLTGSFMLKGDLMKGLTGGRAAEIQANYTKELVQGGSNAYVQANAKMVVFKGAYLNCEYDAVIDTQNNITYKTTGGVVFGTF